MNCLNNEQIAKLALQLGDDPNLAAHVDGCEACRSKLQVVRRLTDHLAAIHAAADRTHRMRPRALSC
jgi:hypothetical protein